MLYVVCVCVRETMVNISSQIWNLVLKEQGTLEAAGHREEIE